MILTYRYRLLPTKRQHLALVEICESQRQLYNAALEERIDCHRKTGKGRSYQDQSRALTECRQSLPEMSALPANLQRWTLKRLDDAFAGFFRRIKAKDKAGFPRFRGKSWWTSFGFREFSGLQFDGQKIRFKGLPGALRVHLHRPLPPDADARSCTFKRDTKGWYIGFHIAVDAPEKRIVASAVGLDLGITTLAHGSNGLIIPNPRAARTAEKKMRLRGRALARCKRGSNRRRKVKAELTRLHAKITNTRKTYLHQQSAMLVKQYDLIAIEALNVKGLAAGMLAREVHDASWSAFINMLRYKAARAGAHLIEVDPRFTSQDCSGCGTRVPKKLAERTHACPACGLSLDRDHNAARNVLHRAVLRPGFDNVAGYGERRTGNITLEGVSKRVSTHNPLVR